MSILRFLSGIARGRAASTSIAIAATMTVALAAGIAVLGLLQGGLGHGIRCVDPTFCGPGSGDHLPPSASGIRLLPEIQVEGFRMLVGVLLAFTLLLLGVAAINLATLALSGASARRGETALRAALGASPGRIGRELAGRAMRVVLPAVLLGMLAGGLAALLIAASWPLGEAPWSGVGIGAGTTLGVAGFLAAAVLLPWLLPMRTAGSRNLRRALSAGERSSVGPGGTMVRDGLVILQVAASLVLLTSAGMLLHGIGGDGGSGVRPGAEGEAVLAFQIALPGSGSAPERAREYGRLLERVRAIPEVVDTSLASEGAWLGLGPTAEVTALCPECQLGTLPKQLTRRPSRVHAVSPGYFSTLHIPVLEGRDFAAEDGTHASRVAIVSRTFAHELFPGADPLGKEIRFGGWGAEWYRVVGLVEDAGAPALGRSGMPEPAVYLSLPQHPPRRVDLAVRTGGDGDVVAPAVEGLIRTAGPNLVVSDAQPLSEVLRRAAAPLRWFGALLGLLSAVMLGLAGTGLHGLVSHGVALRRREIGLRMAIGAGEAAVVRMVVGRSVRLVGSGVVIGLIPLSGVARLLQTELPRANPWDPGLYALLGATLGAIALLASFFPARRAARVEPQVALREA